MSVTSLVKQQNAIGTQSNHLKLGIIGTANVGKSSLFNMLVRDERRISPSENCLFRTTDPYVGIFTPEDLAIDYITSVLNVSAVPTSITVADTAGLVEGSFREVCSSESHCMCNMTCPSYRLCVVCRRRESVVPRWLPWSLRI
jgi:GTPase SAR1 family protein